MKSFNSKKFIITTLLTMFVLVSLFLPRAAYAVDIIGGPSQIISTIWDKYIVPMWDKFGAIAYRNFINVYLGQIAKESAEYIATSGKGQKPTFTLGKDYWLKMEDDLKGEFIDQMSQSLLGRSLCDPFDPAIRFKMLVSFDPVYKEMEWDDELECPLSKIRQRMESLKDATLFEFSTEFREGPVGRYKSDFTNLIAQDPVLNQADAPFVCRDDGFYILGNNCNNNSDPWVNEGVNYLLGIEDNLVEIQNDFEALIEKLRLKDRYKAYAADPQLAVKDLDKLKAKLKTDVWGTHTEATHLSFWKKYTPACAVKSHEEYCGDDNCFQFFMLAVNSPAVCYDADDETDTDLINYTNALAYTKRINKYVKQLIDWANTLDGMIEQTKSSQEQGKDLPDIDPLEDLSRMYSPEGSGIGAVLSLESDLFDVVTKKTGSSKFFQSLQGRMNDITAKISGITLTPSIYVSESARKSVEDASAGPLVMTGVAVADAIGVFTNTLMSKLLKQIFDGINVAFTAEGVTARGPFLDEDWYWPWRDKGGDDRGGGGGGGGGEGGGGGGSVGLTEEQAGAVFADLAEVSLKKLKEMTIYDEFAVCPDNPLYALPTNCLMGNELMRAVEESLTIQQAMDKGLLSEDEAVGRPQDYTGLLSYSNVKKLRKTRIFPLGMEIAAQKIFNQDPEVSGTDWKLEQVVDGFDQVSSAGSCSVLDPLNGSLEIDDDNNNIPDGYARNGIVPPGGISELTTVFAHSGSKSYKTYVANSWYGLRTAGTQNGGIAVSPNTQYTASAYIKTEVLYKSSGGNPSVYLGVHCNNPDHSGDDPNYLRDLGSGSIAVTQSNQEWTQVWQTFTTHSADTEVDHCHVILLFHPSTNGTAYFDDVALVTKTPESYCYLDNNELDKGSCQGQVSLKQGCGLFLDPNDSDFESPGTPNLRYNSLATYTKSNKAVVPGASVAPIDCTETDTDPDSDYVQYCEPFAQTTNDTNTISKVRRDRVCGEWLSCVSWHMERDMATGLDRRVCEKVDRCNKLSGTGGESRCASFVYPPVQVLTEDVYKSRDVSWSGMDYSGYSIHNMYPVEYLIQKETADGDFVLTYKTQGVEYGVDGRNGDYPKRIGQTCKLYPEPDSPFKRAAAQIGYPSVNICEDDQDQQCQTEYVKADYNGTIKYYNDEASMPVDRGICMGGDNRDSSCDPTITEPADNPCPGSTCMALSKLTPAIGISGYCLEPDPNKLSIDACLTWWKGQSAVGAGSASFQSNPNAGYKPAGNRKWYCVDEIDHTFEPSGYVGLQVYGAIAAEGNEPWMDLSEEWHTIPSFANLQGDISQNEIESIQIRFHSSDLGYYTTGDWTDITLNQNNDWCVCEGDTCPSVYNCQSPSCDDGGEEDPCAFVQGRFNDDNKLSGIEWWFDGYYEYEFWNIFEIGYKDIRINLWPGCEYLINIADAGDSDLSTAYTNRLWDQSDYYTTNPGTGDIQCVHYGAIGVSSPQSLIFTQGDGAACYTNQANVTYDEVELGELFAKSFQAKEFVLDYGECVGEVMGTCEYSSENKCFTAGGFGAPVPNCGIYGGTCTGSSTGTCSTDGTACWNDTNCPEGADNMTYVDEPGSNLADITGTVIAIPPVVASAMCDGAGNCPLGPENTISINNQDQGDLSGSKIFPAQLSFYAWADKNQMPVRSIVVDWSGTKEPGLIVGETDIMVKNHKEGCDGSDFGSSDSACIPEPWEFNRTLSCYTGQPGWNSTVCPAGVTNKCCFKPTVYVRDNWGWCNEDVYAGDGNACIDTSGAGTAYNGVIIISL